MDPFHLQFLVGEESRDRKCLVPRQSDTDLDGAPRWEPREFHPVFVRACQSKSGGPVAVSLPIASCNFNLGEIADLSMEHLKYWESLVLIFTESNEPGSVYS